jgi:hypothetical protein
MKANGSVPEGHNESSPALQCWVVQKARSVPVGTIDRIGFCRDRNNRNRIRNRRAVQERSFVPTGTEHSLIVASPALKCWATFTASLRDRSALAADHDLIAIHCGSSDPGPAISVVSI